MKNKKFVVRVLALCATVVLMVALAVPCFADGNSSVVQTAFDGTLVGDAYNDAYGYLLGQFNGTDNNIFNYSTLLSGKLVSVGDVIYVNYVNMFDCSFVLSGYVSIYSGGIQLNDAIGMMGDIEIIVDGNIMQIAIYGGDGSTLFLIDCTYSSNNGTVTVNDVQSSYNVGDNDIYISALLEAVTFMDTASLLLFGDNAGTSVYYPHSFADGYNANTVGGSGAPNRSGLYGRIYYTIRDAVFGSGSPLDSAQEFTLSQISLWLTIAVVLLPIICVVAITVKLLRW